VCEPIETYLAINDMVAKSVHDELFAAVNSCISLLHFEGINFVKYGCQCEDMTFGTPIPIF
jgi:hypothetical protein